MPMLDLNEEFQRLNDDQQKAVLSDDNTVVLAGPGSGKTATLVVKIGHLLAEKITPPAGLACITFNNDAVREFRNRLALLGIHSRRSLFLGTVHSFCLTCVLRPYGPLIDARFGSGLAVAGEEQALALLQQAAEQYVPNPRVDWIAPRIARLRKALACGEDTSGFEDTDPHVLAAYEDLLLHQGVIDFDGIILHALSFISGHQWVRRFVAARFPWLVVDEYQDLGGPLHRIVTSLIGAGVKAFAVGDADQTIYDFTGASPHYLNELAGRGDFTPIALKFNYRSGRRIIDASQAALAPTQPRGYVPDPNRKTEGEVFFLEADGHFADHASKVADAIMAARNSGTPWEEIAVFYRSGGGLLDAIKVELTKRQIPFNWERDTRFPTGPLVRWLQATAAWTLATPQDREQTVGELFRFYSDLLNTAGEMERGASTLQSHITFHRFLTQPFEGKAFVRDYLAWADGTMNLQKHVSQCEQHANDLEQYRRLSESVAVDGPLSAARLVEFAAYGKLKGKVVLTTLHGSKGRQFDSVIIPGCAEGMLPIWTWSRPQRGWAEPNERIVAEARRLFYVGLTRARHNVYLIHSAAFEDRFGNLARLGVSRFVKEIAAKLSMQ
jgi:DNA helicase-2/ATP-dependent DNA helicase PcrA